MFGITPLGYDVDDSLPSSTEIKNRWYHTSPLPLRFNGVDRNIKLKAESYLSLLDIWGTNEEFSFLRKGKGVP